MVDRLIDAAGILWIPCLVIALLTSFPFLYSLIPGDKKDEKPDRVGAVLGFGCLWIPLAAVFFLVLMIGGFILYGGLAFVKALWNAA